MQRPRRSQRKVTYVSKYVERVALSQESSDTNRRDNGSKRTGKPSEPVNNIGRARKSCGSAFEENLRAQVNSFRARSEPPTSTTSASQASVSSVQPNIRDKDILKTSVEEAIASLKRKIDQSIVHLSHEMELVNKQYTEDVVQLRTDYQTKLTNLKRKRERDIAIVKKKFHDDISRQ